MAKKLTITPALDITADDSITRADLNNWFTNAVFGGVDRDHFASGTSPVVSSTTAPTSPATGLGWFDSSTGVLSFWSGSEWVGNTTLSATAPGVTGALWYDTTLNILRRYETVDGITGWHPVDSAYQLMTNRDSSIDVTAGDVLVQDTTATSVREFKTTTVVKDGSVIGVALEAITRSSSGVVATCEGGATVSVLVSGATHGAVAKGDLLASYSQDQSARTVGPRIATPYVSATKRAWGQQYGSFAVALEATSADETIRARMIPVGTGLHVEQQQAVLTAVTQASVGTSAWQEYSMSGDLIDSDHAPVLQFTMDFDVSVTETAADTVEGNYVVSMDQSTTWMAQGWEHNALAANSTGVVFRDHGVTFGSSDDTDAYTGIGTTWSLQVTMGAGDSTTVTPYFRGYVA